MKYPHVSIWINGRYVALQNIVGDKISAQSNFEATTFTFIRDWFSGQEKFQLQTSGSTGSPKLITITREQMVTSAKLSEKALGLQNTFTSLTCIDTQYIGGKMMLVRSFVTGMKIFALDPTACPLHQIPIDLCVNFAAFVPYQIQSALESKHPHLLNTLDVAIIGGAPLDEKVVQKLAGYQCCCYATYGMTETVSHIALQRLNGRHRQDFFETLPHVNVRSDERGCLVIDAPYFSEHVVTNDLAEVLSAQKFRWIGRWDNVINTAGVKVVPEKIEAEIQKIFAHQSIENRFFIHGVKDERLGNKVVLVVEGSEHIRPRVQAAISNLKRQLAPYEIPRDIIFVPTFISTENGKLNRSQTLLAAV